MQDKNRLFGLSGKSKENLIKKVLNKKNTTSANTESEGLRQEADSALSQKRLDKIPEAFTKFSRFPGYEKLKVPQQAAKKFGLDNPYFRVHDGVAGSTTKIEGREYINYASYNYLGLCGHPRVNKAAKEAIDHWGTSVSGSRLTSGERVIQQELEAGLAEVYEADDAVAFISGHATNVTSIGYLFGPKDLVIHDALVHDSILQGIQLSGAHRRSFPHNDWQALKRILAEIRHQFERALIVVEGLYGMDGDYPDLPKFVEIKQRYKAFLMVDEAHSLGVLGQTGKGLAEHHSVNPRDVDIWMGTLSKTLASSGGYIAGEMALVEHLRYSAPGFLYSVGMAPPVAAAASEALKIMRAEPERVGRLHERGKYFLEKAKSLGLNVGESEGYAVIPVITGASLKAVKLSNKLFRQGINALPIIYPGVEEKAARLRFFICYNHTESQINHTLETVAKELGV